ncbi:MAG: helix-turn-helix transcriptional regulator, partial [Clostridia bacterium]|nr:helix-turn-helix transcriptional regulator [Clostridia bacterium]
MSDLSARIGGNIRIYRRANRMTLSELAEKINKSKGTVGKYEQGSIAVDMDTLYEIAAALGVSPAQLLVSLIPEKKEQGEPRLTGERRYMYLYDGRSSRIVRSLLVCGREE